MEVGETKPKKQSVSDIWQSLKNQFTSTRKHNPKSQTNWNVYSKKTEPSRDSILTSLDGPSEAAACDTQPFILGIPKHQNNTTDLGDLQKGLRITAKAVLRSLEEEKQARAVLVNLEGEKKPTQAAQVDSAAATSTTSILHDDGPQLGTSYEEMLEQPLKIPAAENTDDGTTLPPSGWKVTSPTTKDNGVERAVRTAEKGVARIESHSHEDGNEKTEEFRPPKQSESVHLVKLNSTCSHLKSELTKSTDEVQKDPERKAEYCQFENSNSVSDLNHLNPENSLIGLINNHEELQQSNESIQDIEMILDDSHSTPKLLVETTTTTKQKSPSDHHHQGCAERNLASGFSTLNVYSCDVQDEPPTSATDEELVKIINKDVNCLHDPAIDVRYEALHSLHRALLGDFVGEVQYLQTRTMTGNEEEDQADTDLVNTGLFESAEKFAWCVEEVVLKPLLKIFSDPSERCRYLSVTILIAECTGHSPGYDCQMLQAFALDSSNYDNSAPVHHCGHIISVSN